MALAALCGAAPVKSLPNILPNALFSALSTFLKRLAVISLVVAGVWMPGAAAPVGLAVPSPTPGPALDHEPIKPIPAGANLDASKVALGKALFHDPRLSQDGTVPCASCHDLGQGGADGRARSVGVRQTVGSSSAPSVFNSGLNFRQFWDGRAATFEAQLDGPLHDPADNILETLGALADSRGLYSTTNMVVRVRVSPPFANPQCPPPESCGPCLEARYDDRS